MKRWKIYILALISIFVFVGCSKGKTGANQTNTTNTSVNQNNTGKNNVNNSNVDYKSKLDQIKLDYQNKRAATEQDRINTYNDKINSEDQDRVNYYNSRINYITSELQKRNEEQLGLINTKYTKDVTSINGSTMSDTDKATALSNAYNTKTQSETNQTMLYENRKVQLERIKRTYAENIQNAKDNRDRNETNFKKDTTKKYDDEFDKLTSIHVGDGSDWEVMLQKEQREFADYYTAQDKIYNDYVKDMNKWLNDSINGLLF